MAPWCCTPRPRPLSADRSPWCATGDFIELDVPNRRLHLDISEAELEDRLAAWRPRGAVPESGYARLFHDSVDGADTGADFRFLKGCRGRAVGKDSH